MKSFKKIFDFKDKYCKKIFFGIMRILYLFSRKTSSVFQKKTKDNQAGKQNKNFYLLQMKLK